MNSSWFHPIFSTVRRSPPKLWTIGPVPKPKGIPALREGHGNSLTYMSLSTAVIIHTRSILPLERWLIYFGSELLLFNRLVLISWALYNPCRGAASICLMKSLPRLWPSLSGQLVWAVVSLFWTWIYEIALFLSLGRYKVLVGAGARKPLRGATTPVRQAFARTDDCQMRGFKMSGDDLHA